MRERARAAKAWATLAATPPAVAALVRRMAAAARRAAAARAAAARAAARGQAARSGTRPMRAAVAASSAPTGATSVAVSTARLLAHCSLASRRHPSCAGALPASPAAQMSTASIRMARNAEPAIKAVSARALSKVARRTMYRSAAAMGKRMATLVRPLHRASALRTPASVRRRPAAVRSLSMVRAILTAAPTFQLATAATCVRVARARSAVLPAPARPRRPVAPGPATPALPLNTARTAQAGCVVRATPRLRACPDLARVPRSFRQFAAATGRPTSTRAPRRSRARAS